MPNELVTQMPQYFRLLTPENIRNYICPKATMPEIVLFIETCRARRLNPFAREIYLIKYGDKAASIVTSKDGYLIRTSENPNYQGHEAGIVLIRPKRSDSNIPGTEFEYREGSLLLKGEHLVGGWARVFKKGDKTPIYAAVTFDEYAQSTGQWPKMPGTMIRKVALVTALREAFPSEYGGVYDSSEMGIDASTLPTDVIDLEPLGAAESNAVPPQAAVAPQYRKPMTYPETNAQSNKPSEKQIGLIKGLFKGWTDDAIRAKVSELCGRDVPGFDAMTKKEASTVIDALYKKPGDGGQTGAASSPQMQMHQAQPSISQDDAKRLLLEAAQHGTESLRAAWNLIPQPICAVLEKNRRLIDELYAVANGIDEASAIGSDYGTGQQHSGANGGGVQQQQYGQYGVTV